MKITEYTVGRIGIDYEYRMDRQEFTKWLRSARTRARTRGERVKKYRVRSTVGFVLVDVYGNESQAFMSYREFQFSSPTRKEINQWIGEHELQMKEGVEASHRMKQNQVETVKCKLCEFESGWGYPVCRGCGKTFQQNASVMASPETAHKSMKLQSNTEAAKNRTNNGQPGGCPGASCSGSSRLTDVETELRKMTASLSAAGISSGATVLRMAADIVAMSGRQAAALHAIAHCDDLVIRGEDDGPELARRLRFAVNTAEAALSGQNDEMRDRSGSGTPTKPLTTKPQ